MYAVMTALRGVMPAIGLGGCQVFERIRININYSHLRISTSIVPFGSQNWSSFLCHKVDMGVLRKVMGLTAGWKRLSTNSHKSTGVTDLLYWLFVDTEVRGDELVASRQE
jgi:hypothetical protein